MKPKLCYVLPQYDPAISSHYFHLYELIDAMAKDVDIFLFVERAKKKRPKGLLQGIYFQRFTIPPFSLIERLVIFSWLNMRGFQQFYVHYSLYSSLIASFLSMVFRGKALFWYCQMPSLYQHPWYEKFFFRLNLNAINTLVTCNVAMKNYFQETYAVPSTKITVLPLWVNISRFQLKTKEGEKICQLLGVTKNKVILFDHWLSERKGADLIIPVARKVIAKESRVKFLIIGGGPLEESLRKQAATEDLTKKIIFLGERPNVEIPRFLAAADVLFMPSKEEEFGRVLLEAMASGVPIVASDTYGPRAVFGKNQKKFLVRYPDADIFAQKLLQVIQNPRVAKSLSAEGKKIVSSYDLRVVAMKFVDLFRESVVKPKLCYVLSEYSPNISSHYRHIYELLGETGKELDLFLFLEESDIFPPPIPNLRGCYVQKFNFLPFNLLERMTVFFWLRLRGYRRFYTHYSLFSSIITAIVCRVSLGHAYYWYCQSRHRYERKLELNPESIFVKLTLDWPFRANLKLIHTLATCTQEMRNYYKKYFQLPKSHSVQFPLWVNLDRFHPNGQIRKKLHRQLHLQDKPVILFVHWLSERKGADKIISVAIRVIRRIPDAHFLVVGGGPLLNSLKDEARNIGIQDNITFIGAVPNKKVNDYYNAADLFFMPIRENGFGRVLLEAMAYGLPAVASNSLGPKELFKGLQRKFLVDFDNEEAFARAIVKILSDNNVRNKLAKENFALVKNYNLPTAVRNFVDLVTS